MVDLLFFLLLGHFFGDFALQSDRVAEEKKSSIGMLTYHVAMYTLTAAVFLFFGLYMNNSDAFFQLITALSLVVIFIAHWIQDYLKAYKFNGTKQAFYFDQAIHILVLFLIRIFVYNG